MPPQLCVETLRRELVKEELVLENGQILLPTKPGLGVELNDGVLEKFRVA
jgi:L-alanine-DL-glutamate epimerase-like enolase superfamily enzyme